MDSAQLVERMTASVADMALFYVGVADNIVVSALTTMRANLTESLRKPFAPHVARDLAEAFVKAIAGRRHEIEAMPSTRTMQ